MRPPALAGGLTLLQLLRGRVSAGHVIALRTPSNPTWPNDPVQRGLNASAALADRLAFVEAQHDLKISTDADDDTPAA